MMRGVIGLCPYLSTGDGKRRRRPIPCFRTADEVRVSAVVWQPTGAGGGSNKAQKAVVNKKAKGKKDEDEDDDEVTAHALRSSALGLADMGWHACVRRVRWPRRSS